jgi:carbon storage regulator
VPRIQDYLILFLVNKLQVLCETCVNMREGLAMLILTRRVGESIMIGDNIEIIVSNIKGRQAQVSITAPDEIKIYRKEIYRKVRKQQAVKSSLEVQVD